MSNGKGSFRSELDKIVVKWLEGTRVPGAIMVTNDLYDQIIDELKSRLPGPETVALDVEGVVEGLAEIRGANRKLYEVKQALFGSDE